MRQGPVRERPNTPKADAGLADFAVPGPAPAHAPRPRLLQQLGRPGATPLVVVTGPPGSGKSALVADWVRQADEGTRTGWITFDDDQADFWGSVTRCLSQLGLDLVGCPPVPEPGQPEGPDLTAPASSTRYVVVLDGLELTSPRLARQADLVLRKFHDQVTFVITSRVDPPLPVPWFRARGWVVEIRESDLRCTEEEAARILAAAGVREPTKHVAAVNAQVAGWLGGVVLAAHSARNTPGSELTAAADTVGAESVQEYLLRQALETQGEPERELLMRAAVVDELVPGLAERVAGAPVTDLAARLPGLRMLMEPLPGQELGWRFPPMLRDLLRAQLAFENPPGWQQANRRAAGWYRDHGRVEEALDHLVSIDAWPEVADLLVGSLVALRIVAGDAAGDLVEIATRIPGDITSTCAHLVRAAVALRHGQDHEAAGELSRAGVPVRDRSRPQVAATDAVLRAWCASRLDDLTVAEAAVETATTRVGRLPDDTSTGLALLQSLTYLADGYRRLRTGQLDDGHRALVEAGRRAPEEALRLRVMASGYAGLALAVSGRLTDAGAEAARAVGLLEESGTPLGERCPVPYLTLAYVALERGDLTATRRHRDQVEETLEPTTGPVEQTVRALVRAGELRAGGDDHAAAAGLVEAAGLLGTSPGLADLVRVDAAWIALPDDPRRALSHLGSLHDSDKPAALVARAAASRHTDPTGAGDLLQRAARLPRPLRTEVQRLITVADLELRRTTTARGRLCLDEALALAAPEKLHRPFQHVSEPVRRLLHTDTALRARHPWLVKSHQPLRAPVKQRTGGDSSHAHRPSAARAGDAVGLVEPLTAKEMEVLAHLNRLLDTEEIAEVMVVSVNTVRTHVRHVLRKLGVDRRNAAVRRAWELGMLPGPDAR